MSDKYLVLHVVIFEDSDDHTKSFPLMRKGVGSHSDIIAWSRKMDAEAVASKLIANGDQVRVDEMTIQSLEVFCEKISSEQQSVGYLVTPIEEKRQPV